ncbi:glucan biosynthesis protein [Yoonia sp. GPGPB17]|uniref:glucan biosynthesis protein n=1 Tax=Yoonia sp. GPGPB17 TaxID=3026147 RepID=UPI0030C0BC95
MKRRELLMSTAAFVVAGALPAVGETVGSLRNVAKALQSQPYTPNTTPLTPPFAGLDYNAYRGIRPQAGKAAMLPHGSRFAVDLLPPGLYFPDPIKVDKITSEGLQEIAFSPGLFDFDTRYFDEIPLTSPGAGFSGMRVRYPLNAPDRMDEVLVMQGASYFRAIGKAMVYGLSARTVALGTGGDGPEEFPRFIHLRLHPAQDETVRIEGVIDSPSLTAHLDMVLRPGVDTGMEITTTLFPRVDIGDIGIAPLTSMYLKGPMLASVSDDFRPHVHDSDVLAITNGAGERIWRPIANPRNVETSVFVDDSPERFGLYQTPRAYENYQDTEARYHDRPSATVEPLERWGPGAVMLVELPTQTEFLDNIVAFWRPAAPLRAGQEYRYAYKLTWALNAPNIGSLAPFVQGRSGREHDRPGHRRFVVDVATVVDGALPVISTTDGAKVLGISAFPLPDDSGTRVTFLFTPGDRDVAEIRLSLRAADETPLSPVWLHRWTRARDGGV